MSQIREKMEQYKSAIQQLYTVEGKSLNYISKLFSLNRKQMTDIIKNEWKFEPRYVRQTTPKIQKLINTHKPMLLKMLNEAVMQKKEICVELGITYSELCTICDNDSDISKMNELYINKESKASQYRKMMEQKKKEKENEVLKDIPGEVWLPILGYENIYSVSNMGRICSHHNGYMNIIVQQYNKKINMFEVHLYKNGIRKCLKVHRIVALSFIPNPLNKDTVNHIDGDRSNNTVQNLEWSTYSEQNIHKINVLKSTKSIGYSKNGRFKSILIDDKYSFKTIKAAAAFVGVSETQFQRYISGETPFERKIELKY